MPSWRRTGNSGGRSSRNSKKLQGKFDQALKDLSDGEREELLRDVMEEGRGKPH